MPKLTDISRRTESGPENGKFLNKTVPKRKISFVIYIYEKLQWMKSSTYFDVSNANSAKILK